VASSAVFCLTAGDPCDDHSVLQIRGSSELNKVTWTSSSWFCHLKRFFSSEVFVCDADVSRCFAPHRVLTSHLNKHRLRLPLQQCIANKPN